METRNLVILGVVLVVLIVAITVGVVVFINRDKDGGDDDRAGEIIDVSDDVNAALLQLAESVSDTNTTVTNLEGEVSSLQLFTDSVDTKADGALASIAAVDTKADGALADISSLQNKEWARFTMSQAMVCPAATATVIDTWQSNGIGGTVMTSGISVNTSNGQITLPENKKFRISITVLIQGISENVLSFIRLNRSDGGSIERACPIVVKSTDKTETTQTCSFIVDTNDLLLDGIFVVQYNNVSTADEISLNANFTLMYINEI